MRIVFLGAFPSQNGGIRVIVNYANALQKCGHEVTIVATRRRQITWKRQIRSLIQNRRLLRKPVIADYFSDAPCNLKFSVGHIISRSDIPDCDIIIATWWETANILFMMKDIEAEKFYFMQDYGVPGMELDKLIPTFFYPFRILTIADWMKDLIHACNKNAEVSVIENGVDDYFFLSDPPRDFPELIFGHVYSSSPTKGSEAVYEAFCKLRASGVPAKLLCFGARKPRHWTCEGLDFVERPSSAALKALYSSCRAWIFASVAEGFGLPILEAFASGTPVIATPVGIAPKIVNENNGILLDGFESDALYHAMARWSALDEATWLVRSGNALKTAERFSWGRATDKFERALLGASAALHD